MALFRAIGSIILDKGVHDVDFINLNTTGFLDYANIAQSVDWDLIEDLTGQSRDRIYEISDYFCRSKRTIVCWAMELPNTRIRQHHTRNHECFTPKGDIGREARVHAPSGAIPMFRATGQ